jgi:hypothetical protein
MRMLHVRLLFPPEVKLVSSSISITNGTCGCQSNHLGIFFREPALRNETLADTVIDGLIAMDLRPWFTLVVHAPNGTFA